MTVNELQRQVMHLGFESQIEDKDAFLAAAVSALSLIYIDRPEIRRVRLVTRPITPLTRVEKIDLLGGEEATLHLLGKSFSLCAFGRGTVEIRSGSERRRIDFNSNSSVIRARIFSEAELRLFGESAFCVYDIVSYAEDFGGEEQIPSLSDAYSYDLSALCPLFLSLDAPPRDALGRDILGVSIEGGILTLPESFRGPFTLSYRVAPPSRDELYAEEKIRIGSECEHLLPLLTASFLWLDDDSDKAQYYLSLYKDALATLRRFAPREIENEYKTVGGWA